ncbi:MAG TPA: DUF2269 family protein [Acidimicrobiales bacterium]|nr:DUF2269 family protein [Acidimicrobiales bacterium]
MPAPLYDVLLLFHVASALIGFGSVAIGGWAASRARHRREPAGDDRVVRFFRPGIDWPARLVLLVPVLGLAMLFGGDREAVGQAWPWAGLALWCVGAGHVIGIGWPAEAQAQRELAALSRGEVSKEGFVAACARMERAAAVASLCAVAAIVLMVVQP